VARRLTDRRIDLDTLEVLVAVSTAGSLSAAAAALGISQQAVSARIAVVEQLLSTPLVVRSVRGSKLTETGTLLVELAAPVLDAADRLELGIAALRRPAGDVTVAASQTIAELLLPGWLLRLRELAPEVSVRLLAGNTDDVIAAIRRGDAQLGFFEGPSNPPGLSAEPMATDDLAVVVAPTHPWATRSSVELAEVAATALLLREVGSGTRAAVESWLTAAGYTLQAPAAELGSNAIIRATACAGVAPAVVSARSVIAEVQDGRLVPVPVRGGAPTRCFSALWSGSLPSEMRILLRIASSAADARTT
jgi:molybdate transport repressor ModE-like protein